MDRFKEYLESDTFDVFEVEDVELDEAAGAMKGLTGDIKSRVLQRMGGEHSEVDDSGGKIEHPTHLRKQLHQAADSGRVAVVHVDGKPVVGMSSAGSKGVYKVHSSGDERMGKQISRQRPGTGRYYGGTYVKPEYHHYVETDVGKNTALGAVEDHLHKNFNAGSDDKMDLYKNHHVEVKSIMPDKIRIQKVGERGKIRPEMQTNYRLGKVRGDLDYRNQRVTSNTPAGDIEGLKDRAATALAKKHLGDMGSPAQKAKELHDQVGKHIASGDYKNATRAAEALHNHIRNSGISSENPDVKAYADSLKNLAGGYSWGKQRARERMKEIRDKHSKNEHLIPSVFDALDSLTESSEDVEALADIFSDYGLDSRLSTAMARKIVADSKHKELTVADIEAVLKKQVHDSKKMKRIAQAAYDAL
jgi:hypothetical protein